MRQIKVQPKVPLKSISQAKNKNTGWYWHLRRPMLFWFTHLSSTRTVRLKWTRLKSSLQFFSSLFPRLKIHVQANTCWCLRWTMLLSGSHISTVTGWQWHSSEPDLKSSLRFFSSLFPRLIKIHILADIDIWGGQVWFTCPNSNRMTVWLQWTRLKSSLQFLCLILIH